MFSVKRKINVTVASLSGFQSKTYSMISKPGKEKKKKKSQMMKGEYVGNF